MNDANNLNEMTRGNENKVDNNVEDEISKQRRERKQESQARKMAMIANNNEAEINGVLEPLFCS